MKAGWERKKLGDVCEIIKGRKPVLKSTSSEDDLRYLVAKVLRGSKDAEYASVHDRNSIQVNEAEIIIICDGSNSGEVFTGYQGILSSTMGKIVKKADINNDYLRAFLASTFELFNGAKTGSAIPHLDKEGLYALQFPFPPLSEQQRIVAILDEAFEGIATAKANAEKNLKNARALFDSYLNSIFSRRGEGWVEKSKPLEDLCELIVDCEHKTAPTQVDGVPSIRTPNVGKGKLLLNGVYRVSEKTYNEWTRRAVPRAGDLIVAREAPAGNVAVIPENTRLCLGQRTVLIRPKLDVFEPEFLAFFLLQPDMQKKLLAHSRGATVQHVNMKDIRALEIMTIPTLREQRSIFSKVKAMEAEHEQLQSIYQKKIEALDALKKSILHQAFTGAL